MNNKEYWGSYYVLPPFLECLIGASLIIADLPKRN